jgi:hypothetical protein
MFATTIIACTIYTVIMTHIYKVYGEYIFVDNNNEEYCGC